MMTLVYKILGGAGAFSVVFFIGALVGHHEGSLAGAAQVSAIRASVANETAAAATKATNAQKAADAAALAQAQAAVLAANQAISNRMSDLQSAADAIARLKSEVNAYAKGSPENRWLNEPIPGDIVGGLCLRTGSPAAINHNCAGSQVRPDPGGRS